MKEELGLYVITDEEIAGKSHIEIAKEVLEGGARVVQLRDKNKSDREMFEIAKEMAKLCHAYGAYLIVDDRVDVALASGADGVHLGPEDIPVFEVRKIAPESFIIGATVHSVDEALKAQEEGADYLGVGSVFPTATKRREIVLIGIEGLREIVASVTIPVVAIGGIRLEHVEEVLKTGASGIAVCSYLLSQPDIVEATRRMKMEIEKMIGLR
ncbi:MAG: thiamine phosphate synthase [Synergistetes bacterium]|nr:MAG: Thiamine-phosphate synthase [bacterium 42_11]MBC7332588.1 thiamine phosphate synthase [Synergistota bacterium]MDK2872145.1 thiamine-phosphate pyrophosphorylase [bacterium]